MEGTAHGKIILIGEHSVVYGHPAIAIPFNDSRIVCRLKPSETDVIVSSLYEGPLSDAPPLFQPIRKLIGKLKAAFEHGPCHYIIESDIPIGAGLGSSAAIAAAITSAVYKMNDRPLDSRTHYEWVQYSETLAHRNPSGIDALCVTSDHGWFFTKNKREPIEITISGSLVIAYSGETTPTSQSVAHVRKLTETSEDFQQIINGLGGLAFQAKDALVSKDINALGDAMNAAMEGLNALGLSTERIERLNHLAKRHGAIASKLTGGGMGGCVIALCASEKDAENVRDAWTKEENVRTWKINFREEA